MQMECTKSLLESVYYLVMGLDNGRLLTGPGRWRRYWDSNLIIKSSDSSAGSRRFPKTSTKPWTFDCVLRSQLSKASHKTRGTCMAEGAIVGSHINPTIVWLVPYGQCKEIQILGFPALTRSSHSWEPPSCRGAPHTPTAGRCGRLHTLPGLGDCSCQNLGGPGPWEAHCGEAASAAAGPAIDAS